MRWDMVSGLQRTKHLMCWWPPCDNNKHQHYCLCTFVACLVNSLKWELDFFQPLLFTLRAWADSTYYGSKLRSSLISQHFLMVINKYQPSQSLLRVVLRRRSCYLHQRNQCEALDMSCHLRRYQSLICLPRNPDNYQEHSALLGL